MKRPILRGVWASAAAAILATLSEARPSPLDQLPDLVVDRVAREPVDGVRYKIILYGYSTGPGGDLRCAPSVRDGVIGYRFLPLQSAPENSTAPAGAAPEPTSPPAKKPPAQPTLDELLGIKPGPADRAEPGNAKPRETATAPEPSKTDLDRLLTGEELEEAFKRAVTLMGDAAGRLGQHGDAGIDTQRVQEEALRHLDTLLSQLQRQANARPNPKPQNAKQDPSRAQPRPQVSPTPASQPNPTDVPGSARQDGPLKPGLESARAAWGALPARVREMLLQGASDRFSSRYQQMTEQYYRKLAEQGAK